MSMYQSGFNPGVRTAAFIPARAGSKGIKDKNTKLFDGIPLVAHTIKAACKCELIDAIYITTESNNIATVIRNWLAEEVGLSDLAKQKISIVPRPSSLSLDFVQLDEVFRFLLRQLQNDGVNPETLVFLQPTSPFRTEKHIAEAIELYGERVKEGLHTVIAAYPAQGFYWKTSEWDSEHSIEPVHHDPAKRVGRQWIQKQDRLYREAGSIYVLDRVRFEMTGCSRLPPFTLYEMDERDSIDLDTLDDWERAEREVERRRNA